MESLEIAFEKMGNKRSYQFTQSGMAVIQDVEVESEEEVEEYVSRGAPINVLNRLK